MYKYIYNCIYALVPELCSYLAGILWIPIIFFGSVWDGMSSEKRRKARGSRAWSGPRNQRGPESPSPGRSLEAMIFFSKGDGVFRWVAVICTNQFSRFSHWESILFTSQFEELLTGATGEQHVNSVAEITSRVHQILRNYPQSLSQSSIHHWSGWMKIRHQQKNRWCWDSPNPNHHLWGCKTLMSLWFLPRLMATSNHKGFVKKCFPCR